MHIQELVSHLDTLLNCAAFKDYCPNGLQVEGKSEIKHLVTGVTLNQTLIEEAIDAKADVILVHHGLFWQGEPYPITELKKHRLQALLKHDINLLAYHLPLDKHELYGNNAQLGQLWGMQTHAYCGKDALIHIHQTKQTPSIEAIVQTVERTLNRQALLIKAPKPVDIQKIAWCSGGAQSYLMDAIYAGANVFITGEISEQYVHITKEYNVHYIAAGHHATERYGVQALGQYLQQTYGLTHQFIEVDSPV